MRISLLAVIISVHYVVAKHHRYHPMSADLLRKLDDLALPEEVRSTVDGSPPPPNVCQDGDCHHGGVCIDGMGCNCQPGFNGTLRLIWGEVIIWNQEFPFCDCMFCFPSNALERNNLSPYRTFILSRSNFEKGSVLTDATT